MSGSIFDELGGNLQGIGANPLVQGLLGLGAGFGQAAGPSRMPVPLGAAFGAGAQGLMGGLTNAAKLRMLMEQEKRLGTQDELARQQMELQRADFDRKRARDAVFDQAANTPDPLLGGGAPAQPAQSGGYADRMIGLESGGDPNAKNPRSSATGAGQFIDSTWIDMMRRHKPEVAGMRSNEYILSLRNDPQLSREMVDIYGKENGTRLAAAGLPDNDTTRALAHRFGPQGAIQVLSAQPGTPIANVVGGQVMAANPDLAGKTTGNVVSWYAGRMGGNGISPQSPQSQGQDQAAPAPQFSGASRPAQMLNGGMDQYYKLMREAKRFATMDDPRGRAISGIYVKAAEAALTLNAWEERIDERSGLPTLYNRATGEIKAHPNAQPRTTEQVNEDGSTTRVLDRPGVRSARPPPTGFNAAPGGGLDVIPRGPGDRIIEVTEKDGLGREIKRQVWASELMARQSGTNAPNTGANAAPSRDGEPPAPVAGTGGVSSVTEPPKVSPQDRERLGKLETESGRVLDAITNFRTISGGAGAGTALNAFIGNTRAPEAVKLTTAYNVLKTALRSEAFLNTGVLQPAENAMIDKMLLDPTSFAGAVASAGSVEALLDQLQGFVTRGLARQRALVTGEKLDISGEQPAPTAAPQQGAAGRAPALRWNVQKGVFE
jgi:hypothetical protein